MAIKSLELSNVGPFRPRTAGDRNGEPISTSSQPDIKIDFDKQVNLFIGPNNVGKSTVLRVIKLLTTKNNGLSSGEMMTLAIPASSLAIEWRNDQDVLRSFRLPAVYLATDYYQHLNERDQLTLWAGEGDGLSGNVELSQWDNLMQEHGYVANHGAVIFPELRDNTEVYSVPVFSDGAGLSTDQSSTSNIHDGIEYGIESILEAYGEDATDYDAGENEWHIPVLVWLQSSKYPECRRAFNEIAQVISDIAEGFDINIATGIFDYKHGTVGYTSQTSDGEVKMHELSQGTRSVIGWAVRFLAGMALYYHYAPDWKQGRGIFIIDEIDAHLHPSWQRRIIPTLTRHFPNVQIFASTHSPMMVAGLEAGQVHLLKRDDTGTVVWSRNEQGIIGWTADEIYRTFMGIDDPTDERTARHAEELRLLRAKDSLTVEEEERTQELRRLVNEDLLARGALNAQQERFDAMMQEYLLSRASDLSQDGA